MGLRAQPALGIPPLLALALHWLLAVAPAAAQEVRLAVEKPPHYVDEPALVQLVVQGLDESPKPTVKAETSSPDVQVRIASMEARVSRTVRIIQDQISEVKTVVYPIDCQVIARKPGTYVVGPFVITQGGKRLQADAVQLTFEDVPLDRNMRIRLVVPDKPMYPDQRVPITIEWWYAGDLEEITRLNIYSPLFDRFRFAAEKPPGRRSALPIQTKDGPLQLPAEVRREIQGGTEFVVVRAQRTLIPDRPGEFSLEPITATVRRVTRWARESSPLDDFGFGGSMLRELMGDRRRPAETALARAVGDPLKLVVKPFPAEGRPESFAGAVGPGFTLEVAADRTVVRVGDPITVTATLRGAGNIEDASLPPLSADGGLDPQRFRLPEGELSGSYENGVKKFTCTVRVQDESVSELPAIAFSWFDPQDEAYHTTRSKPIALRVMPARVVSAADVVSGETRKPAKPREVPSAGPAAASPPQAPGQTRPAFTLTGADLSIRQDARQLLRDDRSRWGGGWLEACLYAAGLLLIAAALIDRQRADIPAEIVRRRKALQRQRRRIERALREPPRKAAAEISAALRAMIAERPEAPRQEADATIAACDAVVYAPASEAATTLDASWGPRALAAADQIIQGAA